MPENREISWSSGGAIPPERASKAASPNPAMNGREKSDGPIVPRKRENNSGPSDADRVEGRGPTKGNSSQQTTPRTQSRQRGVPSALDRVRHAASQEQKPEQRCDAMIRGRSRMS